MALDYDSVRSMYDTLYGAGVTKKSLPEWAAEQNTTTNTNLYDAGLHDGWWTRTSHALDRNVFNPVASVTTAPLGRALGGLFGAADAGERVGQSLPRALAETLPLYLAGPEAGIPATIAALGGTGALMAAHTYADTGSAKAALVSGVTGAALPGVGKFAGNVAARAFGVGERVAGEVATEQGLKTTSQAFGTDVFVADGATQRGLKAAKFAGTQAGLFAGNEASGYAQAKTQGQDFDPLSADLLLGQIPFTVFDLVHAARAGAPPTATEIRSKLVKPTEKEVAEYVPPVSKPEEHEQLNSVLSRLENLSPEASPEEHAAALKSVIDVTNDPKAAVESKRGDVLDTKVNPELPVQAIPAEDPTKPVETEKPVEQTLQENGVEVPTQAAIRTQDGSIFTDERGHPFAYDKAFEAGKVEQAQEIPGGGGAQERVTTPVEKGWTDKNGEFVPNAPLRPLTKALEENNKVLSDANAKLASVPKTAEEVPGLIGDLTVAKPKIETLVAEGHSPTQAIETVRLQEQTPVVDAALETKAVLKKEAEKVISITGTGKPQFKYDNANAVRDENGKNFPSRALAEATKEADPELADHHVRDDGRGGFYLAKPLNQEVSLEGTGLDKTLDETVAPPVDTRPDVSLQDVLGTLDRVSKTPKIFDEFLGNDGDLAQTLKETAAAREFIKAKLSGADVKLDGPTQKAVMKVVKAAGEYRKEFRNFGMDSKMPYDEKLVADIGAAHPTEGLKNYVNWFVNRSDSGLLGRLGKALLGTVDLSDVEYIYPGSEKSDGSWFRRDASGDQKAQISVGDFPMNEGEAVEGAMKAMHEIAHQAGADLATRTDPQAVQLRSSLKQIMNVLDGHANVPLKVRNAIRVARAEGWWDQFNNRTMTGTEFYSKFIAAVGEKHADWLPVFYGLGNEHELFAQTFGSAKMVDLLRRTKFTSRDPQTLLQRFASAVGKLFGVEPEHGSALEEVLKRYEGYLGGTKITARPIDVRPTLSAGQNFLYGLAPWDPERNLLGGKHTVPKSGELTLKAFKTAGGVGKVLADGEIELYQSLVPEAFVGDKVHVPKLVEGLRKNGPVVKTEVYGKEGNPSPAKQELDKMTHEWLETLPRAYQLTIQRWSSGFEAEQQKTKLQGLGDVDLQKVQRYLELQKQVSAEPPDTSPRATSYYNQITSVDLDKVKQYGGRSVRVDVVLPKIPKRTYKEWLGTAKDTPEQKRIYDKVSQNKIDNPDLWSPDNLHENLPNTLGWAWTHELTYDYFAAEAPQMIKKLGLKPGDKVVQVDEQQSRWGQKIQKEGARQSLPFENFTTWGLRNELTQAQIDATWKSHEPNEVWSRWVTDRDAASVDASKSFGHPLLESQHVLVLKATIREARKSGAKWMFVADGETAMMTEGHDKAGTGGTYQTHAAALEHAKIAGRGEEAIIQHGPNNFTLRPSQDAGMRLHYDQTLPSAMEKLTGMKGEGVEMGVHRGATNNEVNQLDRTTPPQGSPVFRDAAGNPKTQITGRVYDISKVEREQTLFDPKPPRTIVRQSDPYNGRDYLRDAYIAKGIRPQATLSRIATAEKLLATGDLGNVIEGFQREAENGQLPATTTAPEFIPKGSATLRYSDGQTFSGPNHAMAFDKADAAGMSNEKPEHGFTTSQGRFVSDQEAAGLKGVSTPALDSSQLTDPSKPMFPEVRTALESDKPTDVFHTVMDRLAGDIPALQDLWVRLRQDVTVTRDLITHIENKNVPGFVPEGVGEKLRLASVKLNSMKRALDKYNLANERVGYLDNFTFDGFEQTQVSRLNGTPNPSPADPVQNEDVAHEVLGLSEVRQRTSEDKLHGVNQMGPIERALGLTQFMKKKYPAFRAVANNVRLSFAEAIERINTLNLTKAYDPETHQFSADVAKSNSRVATNENLSKAASDVYRIIQQREAAPLEWTFEDHDIKQVLDRSGDPEAIKTEINTERARVHTWTEVVLPRSLTKIAKENTSKVILSHEVGMVPDQAREVSDKIYDAITALQDPAQAAGASEALRQLSGELQPATFLAAIRFSQDTIAASNKFLGLMRNRPTFVSEQRYGDNHLVMRGPKGEAFRASGSEKDMRRMQKQKESEGYKFLDYLPKSDANTPAGGVNADVLAAMKELDVQSYNRLSQALQGVDPVIREKVLPETQRAVQYEASTAAFKPTPGVTRKFVAGRETINMMENANEFYTRANNWLRHRETEATTSVDMLHPEVAGNRELLQYTQQHVKNSLTPDNPFFRKLVAVSYFHRLAFSFGNSMLESVQNLGTGMQALISETGSVTDAFKLWGGSVGELTLKAKNGGKWSSPDLQWAMDRAEALGIRQMTTWNDIHDPDVGTVYEVNRRAKNPLTKSFDKVQIGARKWSTMFQRYNDNIGLIGGFKLGLEKGMNREDAFNFAWDLKEQGYYTGGKAQRPVGLWSISSKPVPQMLQALNTYTLGWFNQMSTDWRAGFGKAPEGITATQRLGSKKAFLYGLVAQATLAGALGMPGVGQGLALLKQATGVDVKGKIRGGLAQLFDEDQDDGGMLTNLAMRGGLSSVSPIDPSNRATLSIPFVGVDPYKGFDISQLLGAPGSSVSDAVKGALAAMHGDWQGFQKLLPSVVKGPVSLIQGEGDVRDARGTLLQKLSPSERALVAMGLPPSRVQRARDTQEAVKNLNDAAVREQQGLVDQLAETYRKGGPVAGQQALVAALPNWKEKYGKEPADLVKAIAGRVRAQVLPYDYRRNLNVAVDLHGFGSRAPSSEVAGLNIEDNVKQNLGLNQPVSFRSRLRAQQIDDLVNSNPYLSRAGAVGALGNVASRRPTRPLLFPAPQEESQGSGRYQSAF